VALSPGTTLGSYRIVAAIGAGGMGEVYRAHDTNLGRDVAIKVLPDAFSADAERLARFEREARVLASLNHTNIATIHGLERSGTTAFLIMELAVGETLAARIARGPVPLDDVLPIATQIAAALEGAHDKGIVHRDLKPANVVVSPDGKVKVLDFGLAKAMSTEPSPMDVSMSPTMAHAGTMAGTILGTAAYMSPEQARGKPVDKRTDIWAFGCVLFEMITGKASFEGETLTDIVAAVVKNDPDWASLPVALPSNVRTVLRRCLKKDPAERLRDIADARMELLETPADAGSPTPSPAPGAARRRTALPWMVALLTSIAAVVFAVRSGTRSEGIPTTVRLQLSAPAGVELFNGAAQGIAVSPDGQRVAFIGTLGGVRNVYVRRLDQFEATPLRGTESAFTCFFSPDARYIGFISTNRSLKRVSLSDGLVQTLTPSDADYTAASAWTADDHVIFGRAQTLWQTSAAGGTPTRLTTLAPGEVTHAFPAAVGRTAVLFTTTTADRKTRLDALTLSTGERHVVLESASFGMVTSNGHLIFFRDGALLAAPFDIKTATVTGTPVRVIENVMVGNTGTPLVALSDSGTLVSAGSDAVASTIVSVTRQGAQEQVNDARRLYFGPRYPPDGRRIVVQAGSDLWIYDAVRATFTRLTSDSTTGNSFPIWTSDGTRVIFRTGTGLFSIDASGGGQAEPIPGTSISDFPTGVSPSGDGLLIARQTSDTGQDVYLLSLRGQPDPKPVVATPALEGGGQYSPDGRWLVYVSDGSGQMQVYIRPSHGPERRWQVSTAGGTSPVWSRNGREVFYRNGNKMMAVAVTAGAELTLSAPQMLFDQPYAYGQTITIPNYDVSPDGQRFLMIRIDPTAGRLNVILNWLDELKRLSPAR